jgi:hypothetical protein
MKGGLMASKSFAINTEPHEAKVGDTVLFFEPEVIGAEFAQAYDALRKVQAKVKANKGAKASSTKHAKEEEALDTETLIEISDAMRSFIRQFLLSESRDKFASMRVPDRVLSELMEWVAELYGGGSGNPDAGGGTSSD